MRLNRRYRDALKHYGLLYLLDPVVTVFVDKNNVLHNESYCFERSDSSVDEHNNVEYEPFRVKIKDIAQRCCYCLRSAEKIAKAHSLASRFADVYAHLKEPVPTCSSYNKLEQVSYLISSTNATLRTASLVSLCDESLREIFDEACDELRKHNEKVKELFFAELEGCTSEFGIAYLLVESSAAALEIRGEMVRRIIPEDEWNFDGDYTYGPRAPILWFWRNLVADGVPAKDRHRRTMKMAGSTLITQNRESATPVEHFEVVATIRHISNLILQLETELAAVVVAEPKTFLVVDEMNIFSYMGRPLCEKYSLRQEDEMHLLLVPEHILHVFMDWDAPTKWALMPSGEKVQEIVVKMWDSDPESVLYSPPNLVNMAETVLQK